MYSLKKCFDFSVSPFFNPKGLDTTYNNCGGKNSWRVNAGVTPHGVDMYLMWRGDSVVHWEEKRLRQKHGHMS